MTSEDYRVSLLVDRHDLACPDCVGTEAAHWSGCPRVADEWGQDDYDELVGDIARDERGAR